MRASTIIKQGYYFLYDHDHLKIVDTIRDLNLGFCNLILYKTYQLIMFLLLFRIFFPTHLIKSQMRKLLRDHNICFILTKHEPCSLKTGLFIIHVHVILR